MHVYWKVVEVTSVREKPKYDPLQHNRKSIRLPGHDYRWSQYFVTIRARTADPIFEIPALRAIIERNWHALPERFPSITLDEFAIMPDHVHFIIWLDGTDEQAPALGRIIGAYKSITTWKWLKHIKEHNISWEGVVWQRNYYEEIIFDPSKELENMRQYIRDNPQKR